MFGTTFDWFHEWQKHVQHLGKYGWEWYVFTPNTDVKTMGNVVIHPMTPEQFSDLVEKKLGVRPNMFTTQRGVPSVHVTDFIVANGIILEDYLKESDFVGMTNLDVVYGRLDHFIPDSVLDDCDVFTDDVNVINGVFSLYRNTPTVNNLFKDIPDWQAKFAQEPCKKCVDGSAPNHTLFGTDEYDLTDVLKNVDILKKVRYAYPKRSPFHSHDRLENHVPEVKLEIEENGSLVELLADTASPNWIHARPFFKRECMYFHFCNTKRWPNCLKQNA